MSAAVTEAAGGALITHPITYPVTETQIAKLRGEFAALAEKDFNEPGAYEEARIAIGRLRSMRTAIEKRRKELKADSLDYGRRVDAAAKTLEGFVSTVEDPIVAKKDAVDAARAKAKEDAERAEMLALEAKLKADREAEEARAKAEREAEEKRLAAERAAHEVERAEFTKRQAEADAKRKADEEVLAQERAKVEAQQREVAAREEKLRADEEARAAAGRERIAAEERARAEAEQAARLEALKPDIEKVRGWAQAFRDLAAAAPDVSSPAAFEPIEWAQGKLAFIADALESFAPGAP